MARIRTTTYTMEKNFCGRCGIILSKRLDIFAVFEFNKYL